MVVDFGLENVAGVKHHPSGYSSDAMPSQNFHRGVSPRRQQSGMRHMLDGFIPAAIVAPLPMLLS